MKIISIDLETTGLPKTIRFDVYYSPTMIDKYDTSRVVSLGIASDNPHIRKEILVKPTDFIIQNSHIHGITNDKALTEGITLNELYEQTKDIIESADLLIGHNVLFDINILASELIRQGLPNYLDKKKTFCTMQFGKSYMKLYKSPKLDELYFFLFKKHRDVSHNAIADATDTLLCYNKMV